MTKLEKNNGINTAALRKGRKGRKDRKVSLPRTTPNQLTTDRKSNIKGFFRKVVKKVGGMASQVLNTIGFCGCFGTTTCDKCTRESQERMRLEFLQAQAKIEAQAKAEAKANTDRLVAEAEAHRKLDEEFKLRMSATPFVKFVSTTNGVTDNKCDCYGMYVSDEKFIFFVFDEETSTIKKIDFGDSGSKPYNLHPLGIAGALLFNEDGTYNIIEKSITFFDIDCGKNNYFDFDSDE
jgi:hypothetical protein